jgi:DNA-binding SARP family transcriptional activator/DNA-binding beta-propeller fold protein YncE/ABC-type branched-subunit amino acid transport system substrate-binding protein
MEPLTFGILGPLQAHRGTESIPVGSGRQAELMALLVTRRNTAVPTERLIDDLWDGRPPDTAAKIVQNAVSSLRRALGDESGDVLVTQGRGYMLVTPAGGTDVDHAAKLLEQGRAELVAGDADGAARTLRTALALWRGPPLPEVAYRSFARDEIARLEELRLVVLEERIAADLARGERAELVPELEQLVARHPLREGFRGQLMLALYRAGRQARALQVYSEGRIALSEELGIEPGENLKRLERAILDHDPDLDGPSRPRTLPVVRGRDRLALAAGAILLAAAAAAAVWMSQSGSASAVTVGGNSIGLIDPASGRILADFPAGDAPSKVVTTGDAAWALSENDGTVTRMDLTTARRRTYRLTAGRASDMVLGGGWLWISVVSNPPEGNGATADVVRLDPDTMTDEGTVQLPGAGAVWDPAPLAYSADDETLWAAAFGGLSAIDPITRRRTPVAHHVDAGALASGLGAVWATPAASSDPHLERIDPANGRVQHIGLPAQSTGSLAVAGKAVWVADPLSGDVWRLDPASNGKPQRVPVGMSAVGISPAGSAVWVADGVSGTIARISSHGARVAVNRYPIGETPRSVAAGPAGALVAVAPGGGPAALTGSVPLHGLPAADCGPMLHGTGEPQRLIAADFQLGGVVSDATLPMRQAIVYALRQHDFQAGRYRVGFQACDDTGSDGYWDGDRCASNARRFAQTPAVIGLIGPFNSGCAKEELALLNRAGPLAVISPSASYPGFTHGGPGTQPGDPTTYRPSGVTSFARVIPSDDMEGIALGQLAAQLGLHRVYVYRTPNDDYGAAVGAAFDRTARSAGIRVLDSPGYGWRAHLGRRLRASGFDGVVIAAGLDSTTTRIIRETGTGSSGRSLTLLAGAFIMFGGGELADAVGERGSGMYVAWEGVSDPLRQLPPAGTRFARAFSATQPNADLGFYTPYAAQAAEVLLAAIANSDGSRASVSRELLGVRIRDGILGRVQFARSGDMTINRLPILRFNPDAPSSPSVYQLIRVAPAAD